MALPAGITTATVTVGVPVTFSGLPVRTNVTITPSAFLVHTATGHPLVNMIEEASAADGVAVQFTLPHTDQVGFQDEAGNAYQNWYYTATIQYATDKATKPAFTKVFQLTTGQTTVDLDLLPSGNPAMPYTAPVAGVTSVNGSTGAVVVPETSDSDVAAFVQGAGPTATALNATYLDKTSGLTKTEAAAAYSALPVVNPAGLDKWRKALGKRRTTPVKIAVTGNSNWEGTGAPDYADRFQTILQDRLRQRYQPAGVTGAKDPNIHLAGMSPVPANPPYTLTGSASGSQYGLGGRGFKLVTGTTVTIPFTGDRVLVRYFKASGGGILNIVMDGGAPVLVDTYSASGVYTNWDSGALTPGAHTLTITRDATTQAGRDIFICDVETFNGDYTKGIRVYDAARHGVTANGLYASQGGWNVEFQNIGGWSLLIIGLGENDTALTKAQYKTEVLAFIAWIRGYGFASSILLVHGPVPGAYNVANWAAFGDAEKEIAQTDPDVAYLDLSVRIPGYDTGGNTLGLYYDTKHKNDAGQAWQADVITETLTTR